MQPAMVSVTAPAAASVSGAAGPSATVTPTLIRTRMRKKGTSSSVSSTPLEGMWWDAPAPVGWLQRPGLGTSLASGVLGGLLHCPSL